MTRCAVIGGGLGGLAAALYLSRLGGVTVDLYEQAAAVGGKAGSLSLDGFRFDTGPTLLTMSFVLEDLFQALGVRLSEYVDLRPLDIACQYHYPDGTVFTAYCDEERLLSEIERVFDIPEKSVRRYLKHTQTIYDLVKDLFLFQSFHEWDVLRSGQARRIGLQPTKIDPFRSMHRANCSFFSDSRFVQYLDRYATFNGSNPFRAPATLNIIHHVERSGAVLPAGGIRTIPEALARLAASCGVHLHADRRVERIICDGRKVRGVRVAGADRDYDAVISNCDVRTTYERLLGTRWAPGTFSYRLAEPSSSALVFYWGVRLNSELPAHTILFSSDYRLEFHDLFSRYRVPIDPTVYIYISKRHAPLDAPNDCENWYVMVNAPRSRGQKWHEEIERTRHTVLSRIKTRLGYALAGKILCEHVSCPADIQRETGGFRGSLYGPSSNGPVAAFLRHSNRSRYYKGLYFCGGSVHPGGGIPLTLLSGKITSSLFAKYE